MQYRRLGYAWVALAVALGAHVFDEAVNGFLTIYNPTVLAARQRFGWFPMPVFDFRVWLSGLILAVALMLLVAPLFFRNARAVRPLGYFGGVLNVFNALGHTAGTILGHGFFGITFARPMPGFYSSPTLLAASLWLLWELRRTATPARLQMRAAPR